MIKSIMKRQVFFHLAKFWMVFLFCFVFDEISSLIPMLPVMLFAHGGKRSNSRSQMFFKTRVLKNFAIFTCSLRPVHYTFPKFCLMIDHWCLRVIFYYCKIRPRNRKQKELRNRLIKISCEDMVFLSNQISVLFQRFFFNFIFFFFVI